MEYVEEIRTTNLSKYSNVDYKIIGITTVLEYDRLEFQQNFSFYNVLDNFHEW